MSQQADTSLAVRGAAWALLRYAIDHFSNGDARAFTRSLVMTAPLDTGTVNLANRLGGAARQVHLEPAFLRVHVAQREVEVGAVPAAQRGRAQRIAPDLHGRLHAGCAQLAVQLRAAAGEQVPAGAERAQQQDGHGDQQAAPPAEAARPHCGTNTAKMPA